MLVAASMPPWGWWPLGFIGLAMYGSVAVRHREKSFSLGFLFATAWFLPSMAWMWFLTAPGIHSCNSYFLRDAWHRQLRRSHAVSQRPFT